MADKNFDVAVKLQLVDNATDGIKLTAQEAVSLGEQVVKSNEDMSKAQETNAEAARAQGEAQQAAAEQMAGAAQETEGLKAVQENLTQATGDAADAQGELATQIATTSKVTDILHESVKKIIETLASAAKEGLDFASALEQSAERLSNMQMTAEDSAALIERLKVVSSETGSSVLDLAKAAEVVAKAGGDAGATIDDINALATAVGADLPAAARAYTLAMQGNARGLRQMQIQFGITAEDLSKYGVKLDELGKVSIKTAEDQETLANALQSVVNDKYGDAIAKHSASIAGAMEDLSSTIQRLQADFGESLAPAVKFLTNNLTSLLKTFEAAPTWFKTTTETALGLVVAYKALSTVSGTVKNVLTALKGAAVAAGVATTGQATAAGAAAIAEGAEAGAVTVNTGATDVNTKSKGANAIASGAEAVAVDVSTKSIIAQTSALYAANKAFLVSAATIAGYVAAVAGIALIVYEANEAINAQAEALKQTDADVTKYASQIKEYKNVYKDFADTVEGANVKLGKSYSPADITKLKSQGISYGQVKSAENKQREFAEGMTRASLEEGSGVSKEKAAAARAELTNLVELSKEYERYNKATAEQIAKQAEEAKKVAEGTEKAGAGAQKASDAGKAGAAAAEREAAAKLKASEAAQEKAKQDAINEKTVKELLTIDEKRERTVKAKSKTETDALTTAIQRCKELLRNDEQLAKNAEARAKIEDKIKSYVEERKRLEEEIAQIRKEAENNLNDAQEKYNQARQKTLEQELSNLATNDPRRASLQAELDERKEKSYQKQRQEVIDEYNKKLKSMKEGSREYANTENALQYELRTLQEDKEREQKAEQLRKQQARAQEPVQTIQEQVQKAQPVQQETLQTQKSSFLNPPPAPAQKAVDLSAGFTGAGQGAQSMEGLNQLATASNSAATALQALTNLNTAAVTSALQSLQTSAMGAAGALSSLTSASRSQSTSNTYNNSLTINSQQQGLSVDTQKLVDQAAAQVEANMSEQSKFNGI